MKKILLVPCVLFLLCTNIFAKKIPQHIKVQVLVKTSRSWDGSPLPKYNRGIPKVTILKITIPPNTKLPIHRHPVINAGVLLKGQLTVITEDNKVLHLKAGDPIVEVVNKWHYGKNEGNTPAEIIVFYAGVKGLPITIKK
ncbi:cupin domain-containing protein [Desulfothermus sp.]